MVTVESQKISNNFLKPSPKYNKVES
jgi:hypothetical protein